MTRVFDANVHGSELAGTYANLNSSAPMGYSANYHLGIVERKGLVKMSGYN